MLSLRRPLLVLAFVVPLVGFLVAQAIARRDRSA